MHFANNLKRLIACQLQDVTISLCCPMELVVGFLYVSQTNRRQDGGEGRPGSLTERDRFRVGATRSDAVSLEHIRYAQCPVGVRARGKVAEGKKIESATRLNQHRFCIILSES